jgi:hypothetical protein
MTSVSRKHSSNKGISNMFNLLFNRKTVVVALAATALLGGGVAMAYPPGTDLTVTATAAPSTDPAHPNTTDVLVTVSHFPDTVFMSTALVHGHTHRKQKVSHTKDGGLRIHIGWDAWKTVPSEVDVLRLIRENR